jgi:hypothetical protein
MRIRCIHNTGEALRAFEKVPIRKEALGRFGATGYTQFGLTYGNEFLVMGMILSEGDLYYLVDDGGHVFSYPYPLFEVIDNKLPSNWFFRARSGSDNLYPYLEATWGYMEFVFDDSHINKLLERDDSACIIYFQRKLEYEGELAESELGRKKSNDQRST